VLGLLRFGNTPLKSLTLALDDDFKAATDKAELELRLPDGPTGEYCLYADRYGIRWHTNVYGGDAIGPDTIYAQQTMRLAYLRRKFYEAMRAGRKITTISRAAPLTHPIPLPFADEFYWEEAPERLRFGEVLPLFLKINEYGTNTLLYLTRCSHKRQSGTVELVAPGVMRGYVDDFVILPDLTNGDHAAWLRIAANAWVLDKGPNATFRNKDSA
jgi:hypothetical protein